MSKDATINGFNRQTLLSSAQLREQYNLVIPYKELCTLLRATYATNKSLHHMMVFAKTNSGYEAIYIHKQYANEFIDALNLKRKVSTTGSDYITLTEFLSTYFPEMPLKTAYDKLHRIRQHNMLSDDATLFQPTTANNCRLYINRKYIDTLCELLNQKRIAPKTNVKLESRDTWIGPYRMITSYNIDMPRPDLDNALINAYNNRILPADAFHPSTSTVRGRGRLLIRCDYMDEVIRTLNLPIKEGMQRIDWLTPTSIASKLNSELDFIMYMPQLMRSIQTLKLLPADAFTEHTTKRHSNGLLLNKKYEQQFLSILKNGHFAGGKTWMSPITLMVRCNLKCNIHSVANCIKQMVINDEISQTSVLNVNDMPFLDVQHTPRFLAKLDYMLEQEKFNKENLLSAEQIRAQYHLKHSYATVRCGMLMAVDQYVLPSDAIISKDDRLFLDKKYAMEFINKLDSILMDSQYTR